MILLCVNELSGPTGYHKSVVETANALHRAGYPVTVLSFLGASDGSQRMLPTWPLDLGIPALALQSLPADGGRLLHRNVHPVYSGRMSSMVFDYTENQLAALRQINSTMGPDDRIIFTSPIQALVFHRALDGEARKPRTVLQIHGDYLHHTEVWDTMIEARPVIDSLQTVASGLRHQFIPTFDDSDVVFIPNFPGERPARESARTDGIVNVALPASFQGRKNQLDAVRALALVEDESVHLTLWGAINPRNRYYLSVLDLVAALRLQDRVHLPGFGTETDVYSSADIVLMTSLSEGFGYPLIEAAYHGLPTVSYDYEFGPRDAIEEGESGFIVPLREVDQLAARITQLAADPSMRARFGKRAQEIFRERFATDHVLERYRDLLGAPAPTDLDLVSLFATDGGEPFGADAVHHRVRRAGRQLHHQVRVMSPVPLHDVQVDNGKRMQPAKVIHTPGATLISFTSAADEVISYVTSPGSSDRHYLASLNGGRLEVLPYLRRDAGYEDADWTLRIPRGGAKRLTAREVTRSVGSLTKTMRDDVLWKVRQVTRKPASSGTTAAVPHPAAPKVAPVIAAMEPAAPTTQIDPEAPTAPGAPTGLVDLAVATEIADLATSRENPADLPNEPWTPAKPVLEVPAVSTASVEPAVLVPAAPSAPPAVPPAPARAARPGNAVAKITRLMGAYARTATTALSSLAVQRGASGRLELPRHPRYAVTAGVDNFGLPVNQPGGVTVANDGTLAHPKVSIKGEYDWVLLRDAATERRVAPPFSYGEMFDRLCAAEREHGLFEITTKDGTHVWELGRSALVIQLAESFGFWGSAGALGAKVLDEYDGPKRLTTAPRASRVVFDYARRGQSGYRTAAFLGDDTIFVTQPEPEGYPDVDDTNLVYPFHEFNRWRQDWRRRWAHQRIADVDPRPFEAALRDAFGLEVDLGSHLRNRLLKYTDERDFWTPVFERVRPQEVLIASSHWWAGISEAAKRAGALVSDIQYALTSHYAPSFWFGGTPHHGASRLYAWSDYWAERTNAYREHVVVPRQQPEFAAAAASGAPDVTPVWDVCVISQPRVLRRILAFVTDLVRERPELRVVIAPHPAQRTIIAGELAAVRLTDHVTIAPQDTLTTILQSELCVGTFSTSLWEAAALGRPTYVIRVPGYEETLADIESGLFRLAASPADLAPFSVPRWGASIFGSAELPTTTSS